MALRLNIINTSRQQFNFTADGIELQVNLDFNTVANAWFLGLRADGAPIFQGRKLVSRIDLANEFTAGTLYAKDASNNSVDVGYDDLVNGNSRLYYLTQAEIAEIGTRTVDTLEEVVELPADFVDGGSIGVPIEDFNALQEKCDAQAENLITFGNALNAAGEDITQLINRMENAEEALNDVEEQLENNSNLINQLLVAALVKEVAFSFNGVLEQGVLAAKWVSTKTYIIKRTQDESNPHKGTATTAPNNLAEFRLTLSHVDGDTTAIGVVTFEGSTEALISVDQDLTINAGDAIEVHTLTMDGVSDVALTLQLTEQV